MKTTFTFLFFLSLAVFSRAQLYTGTINMGTSSPGTTITVSFSLVPPNSIMPGLVIYVYNSTTQSYAQLPTTSTFNGLAYYAFYTIPPGTPNNTILQFAIGTNTVPATYYSTVASATVLPIVFRSFSAMLQGTDRAALKWELADNDHPVNKSIVYRSVDGINFTAMDTVMGHWGQFVYTYTDLSVANGMSNFYRVACVGIDGGETVSSTLVVGKSDVGVNTARILDNANVGNQLFLSGIDLNSYRPSDICVVDVLGRKMPIAVLNSNTLGLNGLKTGMYYLKIGANRPLGFRAR